MPRPVVRIPQRPDAAPALVAWVQEFDEEAAHAFARDVAAIRSARQVVCPVVIDSPGGDAYSLLGMLDVLASVDVPVVTVAIGKAMSCGAALFTCGQFRYIAPGSTLLFHDVMSTPVAGRAEEQQVNVDETRRLNLLVWERMSTNLGKPPRWLRDQRPKNGSADWYLTAREAVRLGVATHVGVPLFEVRQRLDPLLGAGGER